VPTRTLTVDARRIARWAAGFAQRHGPVTLTPTRTGLRLDAADGAVAVLEPPLRTVTADVTSTGPPVVSASTDVEDPVERLAAEVLLPRRVAAVLARRGGYACAVLGPTGVEASKVGTRYVQGRTAAGGWSQQRFARRRENQTADLVRACADVAVRVLDPAGPAYDGLLTGGDRALVERVLADPRLRRLADLPRAPHLTVGDPRSDVVRALPEHIRGVTVTLDEPA
jgi:hypothetical protein